MQSKRILGQAVSLTEKFLNVSHGAGCACCEPMSAHVACAFSCLAPSALFGPLHLTASQSLLAFPWHHLEAHAYPCCSCTGRCTFRGLAACPVAPPASLQHWSAHLHHPSFGKLSQWDRCTMGGVHTSLDLSHRVMHMLDFDETQATASWLGFTSRCTPDTLLARWSVSVSVSALCLSQLWVESVGPSSDKGSTLPTCIFFQKGDSDLDLWS